jgi:hypothetical protein
MKAKLSFLVVLVALAAGSCGRPANSADSLSPAGGTTVPEATDARCRATPLEATDTGVTADTITVQVMADTGSPLAPGLFQGNIDAMKGFETFVNQHGGLGCRRLKVETWDSKMSAEEAKNGQITGCTSAVAMVGGTVLFNPDVGEMAACPDVTGAPTGLPNIVAIANDVNEQCAKNSFVIEGVPETCLPDGGVASGSRPFRMPIGATRWYQQNVIPDLKGIYLVPGDLPSTVQSATYNIQAQADIGVDWLGAYKVSGRAEQAAYTPLVQAATEGANYFYNGSLDTAMINMRREAAAQGLSGIKVWACSIACYTSKFKAAGADVADTQFFMQFLPFEDKGSNQELDNYLESVETPDSFGARAWQAGVLFQDAVNEIVDEQGPNAITRAKLLEVLNGITSFDAHGWMGPKNPKGGQSDCIVMMRFTGSRFERVSPEAPGTFDCDPSYVGSVTLDPAEKVALIK